MTLLLRWRPHAYAVALCLGLAAPNAVRLGVGAAALLAVVASAGLLAAERRSRVLAVAALTLIVGWSWGTMRVETLDASRLAAEVGRTAPVRAVVTAPSRRGMFHLRVHASVIRLGRMQLDEPVLLLLPLGRAPPQGAVIDLVGTVGRPRGPDSGFDEGAWLRRRGAHVVIRGRHWRQVGRRSGLAGVGDRLHERLAATVAPGVEGERRGVIAGVVLGEDEELSEELRDHFRVSGLYHVLAVSGQNVAFLAGGVLLLAWVAGISRWVAEVFVLAAIGAYVLAVGLQPSVVRAGVAGALASLAWLASRPRDRWYFLLVGAAVLLAWNPYNLLEPGFQLSFAAVATIFVAVGRLERRLEGYPLPRKLAEIVAVSAACGAATAPIAWLHFHAVPLYTVLSNGLGTMVVAPILGLGLAAAAIDPVWGGGAETVAWLNGCLAAYLAAVARVTAGLPYAQVTSGAAAVTLLAAVAVAFAASRLHGRARRRLLVSVALVAAAVLAWRAAPEPVPPAPRGLRVTFLDVGQGDAVLVQTPRAAVLVDQGPPEAQVGKQLRRLGIRRLALLVLTHPQRDHVGGAADVLDRIPVDAVLDPKIAAPSPDQAAALASAREHDVRVIEARAGLAFRLGRLVLRVLWPDRPGRAVADPNEAATVLLASYGEVDALLTADAESPVTLRLGLPEAEILKVAHHGSADPGLDRLLARVRPRVAVMSLGADNEYGHPALPTLAALAAAPGLSTYRTDLDGRVTIESDGERLEVRTER